MTKYKVVVLLASYNGLSWLESQLMSILNQQEVEIGLFISDDFSQDSSYVYLQQFASQQPNVHLLPQTKKFNSAGKNFYRLILDVDISDYDYVAFADQDDVWELDKLIRHITLLKEHGVEGVSSDVIAFWPDGQHKRINKSQPQRKFDYLFESAGPGCTFLMTPWLINTVKSLLNDEFSVANKVALHDWLVYGVCRASGRKWYIDSSPSVQYRQHSYNVLGANSGAKAKLARIKKMADGWYRGEVLKVVQICLVISDHPNNKQFNELYVCLTQSGIKSRFGLLQFVREARRSFLDRLFLGAGILISLF